MYIRVNILKFQSKIDADAMRALAKYEMLEKLEGIISIETINLSDVKTIAILKFKSKEEAESSKKHYIDHFKKQSNIQVESFEGFRDFIVEK
tara:strand:- start:413 stop:688 length:276 start_codon:yes stop_codon:yes gene_type:complete